VDHAESTDVLNAQSDELRAELTTALERASSTTTSTWCDHRRGEKAFSAGADISQFPRGTPST